MTFQGGVVGRVLNGHMIKILATVSLQNEHLASSLKKMIIPSMVDNLVPLCNLLVSTLIQDESILTSSVCKFTRAQ